jgi:hypothetical protein
MTDKKVQIPDAPPGPVLLVLEHMLCEPARQREEADEHGHLWVFTQKQPAPQLGLLRNADTFLYNNALYQVWHIQDDHDARRVEALQIGE